MIREGLTFDDVMLVPSYSNVSSRTKVNLMVPVEKLHQSFDHPIVPANMKTIISPQLLAASQNSGSLNLLHRYDDMPFAAQMILMQRLEQALDKSVYNRVGISIGVKSEDYEFLPNYIAAGIKIINVDMAHGDSELCVNMCKHISDKYPDIFIIAGNVATSSGAKRLWQAGADMIRVGVGNGSICTTRIETGNGVPQLTALMDTYKVKEKLEVELSKQLLILNDGGVTKPGDIVKALCFADFVMTGNMFAGCEETPGNIISIDGQMYKSYVGSSTHKGFRIEGVESLVPVKKAFKDVLTRITDGIQSGCSYQGADNLWDLRRDPEFIKISSAGLKESHAHDVQVIK